MVDVVVERPDEAAPGRHVRVIDAFRWGLIPFWAKDAKIGNRMINARSETVATKNAFRTPFAKYRCIVPADSFYEWITIEGRDKKTPMRILRTDGAPFAFAGLWSTWTEPDTGEMVRSCTIITGPANARIARLHDRMPIMLSPGAWDEWLDPDQHDIDALARLFAPAPDELITFHPVDSAVNNARSRGAELIEPVAVPGAPLPEGGVAA
jgi:putative SOS response-associated peptidase YedK